MKSPRIRILHTVYSLEPGGMENGIVNVTNALDPERFEVHICCIERRGAFAERLPSSVPVTVLEKQPGFSLGACRALRREILRIRPNLVHSHNLGPLIYSAFATLGGMTVPILQGEHAELTESELTRRRLRQRRWLYRGCYAVHSVGLGLHRQLNHLFPRTRLRVIVNGVDTGRFRPATAAERAKAREGAGVPATGPVLGIVGRFGPFKRHDLLIEAFEMAADSHPGAHLLVVGGGGPQEQAVARQVRESRHCQRITLAGFQRDPSPFYRAMDLLVVPSVNEGLSNAVLEAMACGIPVLGHHACGNADVIDSGSNGLLMDLSTRERIRTALAGALECPQRLEAMGQSARRKVLSDFSLEKMVGKYENIYSEAATTP